MNITEIEAVVTCTDSPSITPSHHHTLPPSHPPTITHLRPQYGCSSSNGGKYCTSGVLLKLIIDARGLGVPVWDGLIGGGGGGGGGGRG